MKKQLFALRLLAPALILALSVCTLLLVSCESGTPQTDDIGTSADSLSEYPMLGSLPTLYIDLAGDLPISDLTKDEYVGGTATLSAENAEDVIETVSLEMKGRGNYSWYDMEKKQYAIKFAEKQRVLGMGSARKWVLISNYSDKSFQRNYLTLNLAKDIGMPYTTACRYVNLVVNGEYHGLYLLTEKIEIHADRADLDIAAGDMLLEIDPPGRHDNECDYCIDLAEVPVATHVRLCEPQAEDYDETFMANAHETAETALNAVVPAIERGLDAFSEIADVQSFVDWFIVNEFVRNGDSGFRTSCYCYLEDGILHMGPAWDYDTCMGNQNSSAYFAPEGFYISEQKQAYWYYLLMRNKDFVSLVKERWTSLRDDGIFDDFLASIDETEVYLAESIALDNERWPGGPERDDLRGKYSCDSAEEETDYIRNWVEKRIAWLDRQWYTGEK